jgi:hypothetical protein
MTKDDAIPFTVSMARTRELTGLGTNAIYQLIETGALKSVKVLGRRLIILESIRQLIECRADARPPSAFANNPRKRGAIRNE